MRLRVPDEGATVVARRRSAARRASEHVHLDDPVIARADGSVLYNFAVAIDDLDAEITHVVRGEDHLSNTPKQLLVLEALGRGSRRRRLRAPAAAARPRRQEALQAPRRRLGAGAARRRATCPRRCATTSRCSAGAPATTRRSSRPTSSSSASRSSACQRNPARFDERSCAGMNGRLHARAAASRS